MNESFDRLPLDDACSVGEVEWTDSANNTVGSKVIPPRIFIVNPTLNEGHEMYSLEQVNKFLSNSNKKDCFTSEELC